ncbi:MAG TPA: DapH/DapD/GlmU-related protein [Gaiellales bacterium]|nr:DapH/DapD/GlmU-related protein [Gaiellales bacterium]
MTPAAYAVGLARHASDGRLLDAWFPRTNVGEHPESGAKILAAAGIESGSATLDTEAAERVLETIHGVSAETIRSLLPAVIAASLSPRTLLVSAIASLDDAPVDAGDVYLRLHLLSGRRIRPHGANLAGIFGLLTNVAWTSAGPVAVDELEPARFAACARGEQLTVHGVDKFPRMADYVVPAGVRIADADRVRLGAHLAEGTTVMHEGFVNYNAGTLGASMVEGRISAGVVIGDGSDVGGGASIMGTLSGGNEIVISVGERCLLGANSGLGIPLGDDCTLESGLYLTAGTKVRLPDGAVVRARELSGISGMLFRRDSQSGAVEAHPRAGAGWHGLNAALHAN